MDRWSRRQLVQGVGVAGLGLVAGCGRLPWQAQPAQTYRLGWLAEPYPTEAENLWYGLRDLGYAEGRHLVVERRWSTDPERRDIDAFAAELVGLPVDVIVTASTPSVLAAQRATLTIPIVSAGISDPVGSGLVANL